MREIRIDLLLRTYILREVMQLIHLVDPEWRLYERAGGEHYLRYNLLHRVCRYALSIAFQKYYQEDEENRDQYFYKCVASPVVSGWVPFSWVRLPEWLLVGRQRHP